jgi:Tfp pilus assembly protein PilF
MKRIIFFIFTILLLTACGTPSTPSAAMPEASSWQEQYDLGFRFLSEGNYEEAIIAFTAAIEIEDKHVDAYVGRGDAYTGLAALALAEQDLPLTEQYCDQALADYEAAVALGATEDVQKKLKQVHSELELAKLSKEAQQLLEPLYAAFVADDLELARELMRQEEYRSMSDLITEGYLYYEGSGAQSLAAYPNDYYYFGGWDNGIRSGEGLWFRVVYDEEGRQDYYLYQGTWADDFPNGVGHIEDVDDVNKIQLEEGHTTSLKTEITGSFSGGYYHGEIYEVWHMNDGGVMSWSPIQAKNGVYQPCGNLPSSVTDADYYASLIAEGGYVVALIDTGHGFYTTLSGHPESSYCIDGLGLE